LLFIFFELSLSQIVESYVSSKEQDSFRFHLMTIRRKPGPPAPISNKDCY